MTTTMESGLPGLPLEPGDHLCGFFFGTKERDEVLIPYLQAGLAAGDNCICIVDSTEPSQVLASIGPASDVDAYVASEQLDVRTAAEAYLRTGTFSPEGMIEFLDAWVSNATSGGASARVAGETTWSIDGPPGSERLIEYEAKVNAFLPRYPQAVYLCLYDLECFGGGLMVDILRTHPKLWVAGLIIDNPFYLSPDEFFALRS